MRKINRYIFLAILFTIPAYCSVYQRVLDRSVVVHIKSAKEGKFICSGTYIGPRNILTAGHCATGDDLIWAKDDEGRTFECRIIKMSKEKDLALLGIVAGKYKGHKYSKLGNSPSLGDPIIVAGSPFGLNFMVSQGIVSKLHVFIPPFTGRYTLHTAMINPGSSGGGLFDVKGRLIGVNTMSIGGPFGWVGISAAVDLNTIKEFLR